MNGEKILYSSNSSQVCTIIACYLKRKQLKTILSVSKIWAGGNLPRGFIQQIFACKY
jgi:hypothetical protein